jgi:hypothetical protein
VQLKLFNKATQQKAFNLVTVKIKLFSEGMINQVLLRKKLVLLKSLAELMKIQILMSNLQDKIPK